MAQKIAAQSLLETTLRPPVEKEKPPWLSHYVFTQKWIHTVLIGFAYAYLFYQYEVGLNVLIFDVLLLLFYLRTEEDIKGRPLFIIAAGGLLVSSISVVIVNSGIASFAHITSLLFLFGVANVREIRFIWFGLLLGLINVCRAPADFMSHWQRTLRDRSGERKMRSEYFVIPALIVLPFLGLYYMANAAFAAAVDRVFYLGDFVAPSTMFLFIWGSWLAAALLFPFSRVSKLAKIDQGLSDDVPRKRKRKLSPLVPKPKTLALTHEFRVARFTFIGLNALLLVVNLSDLLGLVFFRRSQTAAEFSQAVHSGTYLLILSIVLAIGVVAFFFRGLLNYYPKVAELRKLAFAWIGQNALLAIFVLVRNLLYVQHSGLAWGRVLVFFWLTLIAFGLFSLYRKVDGRLSLSYLLHANGMAAWLGLLLLGAVNWDGAITRYNLATQSAEAIDYHYLINGLGNGNAFLLAQDPNIGGKYFSDDASTSFHGKNYFQLDEKLEDFYNEYHISDWRSWNYADYRNQKTIAQVSKKSSYAPIYQTEPQYIAPAPQ